MSVGIGLDLLDIDRLERALARRPSLAHRLFTPGEQAYAAGRARPGQHLAARFCAKEAVTKALQLDVMRPLEIEVRGGGSSEVGIMLSGATADAAAARGLDVRVSLTHTPTTAGAVAIAQPVPAR
ncbi:MAG: holo-ACP synthase [Solirubrobacterales bacterium]|nr:holo-ACP synthase [Solirubrobacterales bacterium]